MTTISENESVSNLNHTLESLKISEPSSQPSAATGNNAPTPVTAQNENDTKTKPSVLNGPGNNNEVVPTLDEPKLETRIKENSIDGIIMDEYVPITREEHAKKVQEEEERRKVLDANNAGDTPNIPRGPEEKQYPAIATEDPKQQELRDLTSCKVRWLYRDSQSTEYHPLKGRDSQLIEIKHRERHGIPLDVEAENIRNTELKDHVFEKVLYSPDGSVPFSRGSSTEESSSDDEEGPPTPKFLVLNGLYRVNKKESRLYSVYWKNDMKKLIRGTYFTLNNKPIEQNVAEDIEKHLEKFNQMKMNGKTDQNFPPPLLTHDHLIEWTSISDLTIKKRSEEHPTQLIRYCEKAKWEDCYPDVEHLVFVVHGVGHDGKEQDVVEGAKLLNQEIKKVTGKPSSILCLPINWRSHIPNEPPSPCPNNLEEDFNPIIKWVLPDVKLYNCIKHGAQIRKVVIDLMKKLYKKFKNNNPECQVSVSLFGHSLGSVISYDILTMKELKKERKGLGFKVDKLFTVGSPLKEFLKKRGDPSREQFLRAIDSIRIYNVYHKNDLVARRLEPYVNQKYKNTPELQLPTPSGVPIEQRSLTFCKMVWRVVWNPVKWTWRYWKGGVLTRRRSLRRELPYPIDHVLQENLTWNETQPHSIYWDSPGVAYFLVNTLRDSRYHLVLKAQESTDSEEEQVTGIQVDPKNNETYFVMLLKTSPKCKRRAGKIPAIRNRKHAVVITKNNQS